MECDKEQYRLMLSTECHVFATVCVDEDLPNQMYLIYFLYPLYILYALCIFNLMSGSL